VVEWNATAVIMIGLASFTLDFWQVEALFVKKGAL
jgi:hypothetical protein